MTPPHILLVEDNPDDALLVQRSFRRAQVQAAIHVVHDGDAAVAYLAGDHPFEDRLKYPLPSLMLLDLKLPRRSGFEVLEWVRRQPGLRRLPVVMLTSSAEDRDVARAYDSGANSFLVKPVSPTAMSQMAATLSSYWLTFNHPPLAAG
jgi:CheY-like chemotaxis protein